MDASLESTRHDSSLINRARKALVAIAVAFSLAIVGVGVSPASSASAATSNCGSGACTVYLTKAETIALSQGRVPRVNIGALTIPFTALALGHVGIAKLWVNRGYCVAFTVNIRPWANQGMLGYRC